MFLRLYPTDKYAPTTLYACAALTNPHRLIYIPFESRHIELLTTKLQGAKSKSTEKTDKMTLSPKSLAGPGYIILNGIRVMNIIGFLAVITASVVMLVKIDTDTHLFFFDAVSHVITLITSSKSCPL